MKVDRDKAIVLEADGWTQYFCSEHCRDAYLAEHSSAAEHHAAMRPIV
jgi:YHS domain-containing protein